LIEASDAPFETRDRVLPHDDAVLREPLAFVWRQRRRAVGDQDDVG
jgi:hypothetical protein